MFQLEMFFLHENVVRHTPYDLTRDNLWWRHQIETISALLAICAGNSPVTVEFPSQKSMTRTFDIFVDLHLNNGWVNTWDAGDLRRHRVHYDITVMC